MPLLPVLLGDATMLAAVTGLVYTIALVSVALTSIISRSPARRRDARATLAILIRRAPTP
ncbi:hypothetical protein ABIA31_007956 [Catenulispora sp. MAP5-51]